MTTEKLSYKITPLYMHSTRPQGWTIHYSNGTKEKWIGSKKTAIEIADGHIKGVI